MQNKRLDEHKHCILQPFDTALVVMPTAPTCYGALQIVLLLGRQGGRL